MKLLTSSLLSLVPPLAATWPPGSLLQQFLAFTRPGETLPESSLPLDVYENPQSLVAVLEVPGVPKEHLRVDLQAGQLQVSITPPNTSSNNPTVPPQRRSIQLPAGFQPDSVSASLRDGLLIVTIPKPASRHPQSIPIE